MKLKMTNKLVSVVVIVVVGVLLIINIGSFLNHNAKFLYNNYAPEMLLTLAFYFTLKSFEKSNTKIRKYTTKLIICFAVPTILELLQYLGLYWIDYSFDAYDIMAYLIGAMIGLLIDFALLRKNTIKV